METNESKPEYQPFVQRFGKYLNHIEKVALVIAAIAVVLRYMKMGTDELVTVGFMTLACVYFLFGFQRPESTTEEKTGFSALLTMTVLPKLLWISCAVSVVGIDFYVLGQAGYKPMLQMGFVALSISLVIFVATSLRALDQSPVTRVLYRAIPVALVDAYILFVGALV